MKWIEHYDTTVIGPYPREKQRSTYGIYPYVSAYIETVTICANIKSRFPKNQPKFYLCELVNVAK